MGWAGVRGGKIGILFNAPFRHLNAEVDYDIGCVSLESVKINNRKNLTKVDLWARTGGQGRTDIKGRLVNYSLQQKEHQQETMVN